MSERALRIAIGVLSLIGVGIAAYLTYVHFAGLKPFCVAGSGGCETVQASPQAKLAGIPVAVLGLVGYVGILVSVVLPGDSGRLLGAGLAISGLGFSLYLTYEELFVIHAVCQWCAASAVLMAIIAVLASMRVLTPARSLSVT